MPRRAPRNPRGARGLYTPELGARIIELVAAGNYITTAAQATGISDKTIYEWVKKGEDAAAATTRGEQLAPRAHNYLEFAEGLARARARAEVDAVEIVEKVMAGGFLLEEEPLVSKDGTLVRDADGEIMMRRKYAPPDGKLALQYLGAAFPLKWRPNTQRVEITGADGAPVQVETTDRATALAEQLQVHIERRQLEAGGDTAGDAEDAEILGEEEQ